jgi:hypothetical protein
MGAAMKKKLMTTGLTVLMAIGLVFVSGLTFRAVHASTDTSNIIKSDTTWAQTSSSNTLTGAVFVNHGGTLTVKTGAFVKPAAASTDLTVPQSPPSSPNTTASAPPQSTPPTETTRLTQNPVSPDSTNSPSSPQILLYECVILGLVGLIIGLGVVMVVLVHKDKANLALATPKTT